MYIILNDLINQNTEYGIAMNKSIMPYTSEAKNRISSSAINKSEE